MLDSNAKQSLYMLWCYSCVFKDDRIVLLFTHYVLWNVHVVLRFQRPYICIVYKSNGRISMILVSIVDLCSISSLKSWIMQ